MISRSDSDSGCLWPFALAHRRERSKMPAVLWAPWWGVTLEREETFMEDFEGNVNSAQGHSN